MKPFTNRHFVKWQHLQYGYNLTITVRFCRHDIFQAFHIKNDDVYG